MSAVALMSEYVAFLRAMYNVHQQSHWTAKGNSFYGNHLMFERLYQGAQEMADEAAEKTLGLFDSLKIVDVSAIADMYNSENPIENSLRIEQDFQKLAKNVYTKLKASKDFSLGLDDMIMEQASKSETHIYLLKQSR